MLFLRMGCTSASTNLEGVSLKWRSTPPGYGVPVAAFTSPDTVFAGYKVTYVNKSTGKKMNYAWDTDGDGIFETSAQDPSYVFSTSGPVTKSICLVTSNCVGSDQVCRNIVVLPQVLKPQAKFTALPTAGFTTDTFFFKDQSINGPVKWKWIFTVAATGLPATGLTFLNGTADTSEHPVVFFGSPKLYTVKLIVWNTLGYDTLIKAGFIHVLAYSTPSSNTDPRPLDIGISRVKLNTIDTSSALLGPPPSYYQGFYNSQVTTLYRGVDYTLSTYRLTNNHAMSTRAWIDFNRNASFGSPAELIMNEKSRFSISASVVFRIPDNAPPGNTRLRIGVTVDSTLLTPDQAQQGCFEDYGIIIGTDRIPPVVTLKGNAVVKIKKGSVYTEDSVLAIDNLEGDISKRFQRSGSVDVNVIGITVLTYTATDLYGNVSAPVTRIVNVEPNVGGPKITLSPPLVYRLDVFDTYHEPGFTAVDNSGNPITLQVQVADNINRAKLGTYYVKYMVTDAFGAKDSAVRTVVVQDTMRPVIFLPGGGNEFHLQTGHQFFPEPVVVTDQYDSNVILKRTGPFNVYSKGTYSLRYDAEDASGNHAIPFYLNLKVGDFVAPTIELNGDKNMKIEVFTAPTFHTLDPGVRVDDNLYRNALTVTKVSNINMSVLGNYEITYTVTDPELNSASVTRYVTIQDTKAPGIIMMGVNPFSLTRYKRYVDAGVELRDNYYPEDTLNRRLVVHNPVINHKPGPYYVTYTVTDPSGNMASAQRLVYVTENGEVGMDEKEQNKGLRVYPNPSTSIFTIEVKDRDIDLVRVFNITGSLVKEIPVPHAKDCSIDLGGESAGIYLLKVSAGGTEYVHKVSLMR